MRLVLQAVVSLLVLPFGLNSSAQTPAAGARIAPSSGKHLCSALTPSDFTRAGVPVSKLHEANLDDNASAYCVYESRAGRVEFDIFYPAGETAEAAKGTERTVLGEVGGKFENLKLADADSASINLTGPGKRPSASIVVRRKIAVFTINIPAHARASEQLRKLSQTVLGRLDH
jgi:hypothetical protein